jgi:hypothetical protein
VKNLRISSNRKNTIKINLKTKKEKKNPINKLETNVEFNGFCVKLLYNRYNPIYPKTTAIK